MAKQGSSSVRGLSREHEGATALADALRALPHVSHVEVTAAPGTDGHDATISLHVGGRPLTLLVDAKTEVYPRQARELILRWQASGQRVVVAADTMSETARGLLSAAGLGSHSADGKLRLPFEELYVAVDLAGQTSRPASRPPRFRLFTAARIPVIHALLLAPDRWCSVSELAAASGVSMASVSKLLAHMETDEWVDVQGSGPGKARKLAKPAALLDQWVAEELDHLAERRVRRFYAPGLKDQALLASLAAVGEPEDLVGSGYAVTGEAAAQAYAPYLTQWSVATVRATSSTLARWMAAADLREVQQGANLHVIEVEPSGLRFTQERDEVRFASPVQTYVDLMVGAGRSPDAGRFLREQVLGF